VSSKMYIPLVTYVGVGKDSYLLGESLHVFKSS